MAEPSFSSHYDRFFKELFARQENARDFLQRYLPSFDSWFSVLGSGC